MASQDHSIFYDTGYANYARINHTYRVLNEYNIVKNMKKIKNIWIRNVYIENTIIMGPNVAMSNIDSYLPR